MRKLSKEDVLSAVAGENAYLDYNPMISSVVTDSRRVEKDSLYVAIAGERVDGHDFIDSAIERGAALVLARKGIVEPGHREVIEVEDTVQALGDLAKRYLSSFSLQKFAVTGSSGKTTTKDMMYYVLAEGLSTHRSEGNHNNEIGLPLTIMDIPEGTKAAIFEMGMYTLGEIEYLSRIVKPDIAVITNIGTCHIERLGTRDNIFKAKMEITHGFHTGHTLIVNGDNDYLGKLSSRDVDYRLIKCGLQENNDLIAYDISTIEGTSTFRLKFQSGKLKGYEGERLELPAIGEHNIQNALCAIACGMVAGLDMKTIAAGLKKFKPSGLRMEITQRHGITIINDSYNANPESMKAVLNSISGYGEGRKIAVLGDMLELGEFSGENHRLIGEEAARNVDILILIGQEMKKAIIGAKEFGLPENHIFHFMDNGSATDKIKELMQPGDSILLKGSRGMKLDEIADRLKQI